MTKHIFMQNHNPLFHRFAILTSLLMIGAILLESLRFLGVSSSLDTLQANLLKTIGACILLLSYISWYLKKQRTTKPFFICLSLIVIAALYLASSHFTPSTLLQSSIHMILGVLGLSLLWWLQLIIQPNHSVSSLALQRSLRLWGWLAMAVMIVQISLTCWIPSIYFSWLLQQTFGFFSPLSSWLTDYKLQIETFYQPTIFILSFLYLGGLGCFLIFKQEFSLLGMAVIALIGVQALCYYSLSPSLTASLLTQSFSLFLLLATISFLVKLYRKPSGFWY